MSQQGAAPPLQPPGVQKASMSDSRKAHRVETEEVSVFEGLSGALGSRSSVV